MKLTWPKWTIRRLLIVVAAAACLSWAATHARLYSNAYRYHHERGVAIGWLTIGYSIIREERRPLLSHVKIYVDVLVPSTPLYSPPVTPAEPSYGPAPFFQ